MRLLDIATYFTPDVAVGNELDDDALRALHAYPAQLVRPWIRVNFVASIDGSVTADGASEGLGTPADARVFGILREMCDAVLVAAGTVRAEDYGGVRLSPDAMARRVAHGLRPVPTVVVVTATAALEPGSRLFVETNVSPVILTSSEADSSAVDRLRQAGAHVVRMDRASLSTNDIVATLDLHGFRRILCEGGPGLFGQLVADDAVDELCLTLSPLLVGGRAGRIAQSPKAVDLSMNRVHVVGDDDGTVLTRWVRPRTENPAVDSLAP